MSRMSSVGIGSGRKPRIERWVNMVSPTGMESRAWSGFIGSLRTVGPQPHDVLRLALPWSDSRTASVPLGGPLVGVADAQHRRLVEWPSGDLERERQPLGGDAAGHPEGRDPRHVERRHVALRK